MKTKHACSTIVAAALGLLAANLSASTITVSQLFDFNDNSVPLGWTYTRPNGPNNGFFNGRWEGWATDGHGLLTMNLNLAGGVLTALKMEWDGNNAVATNGNGSSTHAIAVTGDGRTFRAAGASGTYYGPTSPVYLTTQVDPGYGNGTLFERTPELSYLHYVASFSDGRIDLAAYLNGGASVFGTSQLILPGEIALADITALVAFTAYTTGNDITWMDNLQIDYTYTTASSSVPDTSSTWLLMGGAIAALAALRRTFSLR